MICFKNNKQAFSLKFNIYVNYIEMLIVLFKIKKVFYLLLPKLPLFPGRDDFVITQYLEWMCL